jgi:hypothetical protein
MWMWINAEKRAGIEKSVMLYAEQVKKRKKKSKVCRLESGSGMMAWNVPKFSAAVERGS